MRRDEERHKKISHVDVRSGLGPIHGKKKAFEREKSKTRRDLRKKIRRTDEKLVKQQNLDSAKKI